METIEVPVAKEAQSLRILETVQCGTGQMLTYWQALVPHTHGFYTLDADDEVSEVFNRNYQCNYPQLVALKNRYDPQNLFRLNANIRPTV